MSTQSSHSEWSGSLNCGSHCAHIEACIWLHSYEWPSWPLSGIRHQNWFRVCLSPEQGINTNGLVMSSNYLAKLSINTFQLLYWKLIEFSFVKIFSGLASDLREAWNPSKWEYFFWQPINLALLSMSFCLPSWSLLNHCENDISELCGKVFRGTTLKERL